MENNLCLEQIDGVPSFADRARGLNFAMTKPRLDTLQINIGNRCNLTCNHCHLAAGPARTEIMSRETMEDCLRIFEENAFSVLDVTGGSPEMNPDFEWLVARASKKGIRTIVRTNLAILREEGFLHLPEFYARHKVEIIASLPCYSEDGTDNQRGAGVFKACLEVLQKLNVLGYGITSELVLNLAYNPGGAFLPPNQANLSDDYKKELMGRYGIVFNQLFTITNNPIGRFGQFLNRSGSLKTYMQRLVAAFNPATVENMMCRRQLSVGWNGLVYDCDFNLALGVTAEGIHRTRDIKGAPLRTRKIVFGNHCYACTAGSGSSCGGATA